jgi:hypothetical protein
MHPRDDAGKASIIGSGMALALALTLRYVRYGAAAR